MAGLVGIEKNENGYRKIQNQILKLRRSGRLAYNLIADPPIYGTKLSQLVDHLQGAIPYFKLCSRNSICRKKPIDPFKLCRANNIYGSTSVIFIQIERRFVSSSCFRFVIVIEQENVLHFLLLCCLTSIKKEVLYMCVRQTVAQEQAGIFDKMHKKF